jgi:Sap, sulfolipid-1-addressing protein
VTLDLILIGLGIAFDPIPLTAFLVVLLSKRGAAKGAAFVSGWLVSLALVVTATVLLTGNRPPRPHTSPATAALAVRIALGVVLVAAAIRQWRRMRQRNKPKPLCGGTVGAGPAVLTPPQRGRPRIPPDQYPQAAIWDHPITLGNSYCCGPASRPVTCGRVVNS